MHAVEIDLSTRSTKKIQEKLAVAIETSQSEMVEACRSELEERGEPDAPETDAPEPYPA